MDEEGSSAMVKENFAEVQSSCTQRAHGIVKNIGSVTKSKFVLLSAQQGNKSRDEVLGQGRTTLFGKAADGEDGGLVSQRTIFPELEFMLLLH